MYVRIVDGQRCVVVHIMAKSLGEGKGMEKKAEGNLFVSHRGFSIIVALVRSRQIRSIIQFHSPSFPPPCDAASERKRRLPSRRWIKKLHTTSERASDEVNLSIKFALIPLSTTHSRHGRRSLLLWRWKIHSLGMWNLLFSLLLSSADG